MVTRIAGGFLAVDLTAAAADFAAGQGALRSLALIGQNGTDNQMHGGHVGRNGKNLIREIQLARCFTLHVKNLNAWHKLYPPS